MFIRLLKISISSTNIEISHNGVSEDSVLLVPSKSRELLTQRQSVTSANYYDTKHF